MGDPEDDTGNDGTSDQDVISVKFSGQVGAQCVTPPVAEGKS